MDDILSLILQLFGSAIGAAVGAYFAVLKLKSEKLWIEKYETLKSIVSAAESIAYEADVSVIEKLIGIEMTDAEKESLCQEVIASKSQLRKSISQLKLLFKESELEKILGDFDQLDRAVKMLLSGGACHQDHDNLKIEAMKLVKSTISLAQKKCI